MKKCTWCGKEYSDDATVCAVDRQPLAPCVPSPEAIVEQQASLSLPPIEIVVPIVLWVGLNVLLCGWLGPVAVPLFGLAIAVWAAIDSSQFKYRGTRVLGMPFKPILVFAVCAFFLWGFGFVWYVIMRHRIKSAPIIVEKDEAFAAQPAQRESGSMS